MLYYARINFFEEKPSLMQNKTINYIINYVPWQLDPFILIFSGIYPHFIWPFLFCHKREPLSLGPFLRPLMTQSSLYFRK